MFVFFFKQKTAYEIDCDWSSDVCSSDLHGGNDAQKTAGIIWMLLIASGHLHPKEPIPNWVISICYITIGLGTAFGGWRIVKTMGQRITKLRPVGGFCAETAGGIPLLSPPALC